MIEIPDDEALYRWLAPRGHVENGVVLSNAFKRNGKPDPSISVDRATLSTPTETAGRGLTSGSGACELVTRFPRHEMLLTVRPDPLVANSAHALIEGVQSRAQCKQLAEAAGILITPDERPSTA